MDASIVLGQLNFMDTAADCTRNLISRPSAIKLDASENLWVTLYGNNRALRFNAPFTSGMNASKVLGQADYISGDANRGIAVADNSLFHPESIGLDSTGNIWIADSDNNRVLRFNTPLTNGMSADRVLGQADFVSNSPNQGGAIDASTLDYPAGIVFDSAGDIWVSDKKNNRIFKYEKPISSGENAKAVLGQINFRKGEALQVKAS
jgi:sugar lactone lactonase YvrE